VAFAQVPTTLLAQVDSSVGGKTGVDLRAGKNLAGAFKQPLVVLADTAVLGSLPEPEWASGLAEVAKSAVIDSEEFLSWVERSEDGLRAREAAVVAEAVRRCVTFKARVVSADEREQGERECLNYGHTFGHALEAVAGYGTLAHGLAVAEGMRFAARLAVEVASAPMALVKRQDALLDALGLPFIAQRFEIQELLGAMRSDKKARNGSIRFVLPTAPGEWRCEAVAESTIVEHLAAWQSAGPKNLDDTPND
jgi:3-dehydroquinate synthase